MGLCIVVVVWLFLTVPWVCLQFVIVVFPDHTHLLFLRFSKCLSQLSYHICVSRVNWTAFELQHEQTNRECGYASRKDPDQHRHHQLRLIRVFTSCMK